MRDNCDKAGVVFEAIRMDAEYINLPKGPERDRRLESILGNIQKASQVGVQYITYHWTVIPIRRNLRTPGRGGINVCGLQTRRQMEGPARRKIRPSHFRGLLGTHHHLSPGDRASRQAV